MKFSDFMDKFVIGSVIALALGSSALAVYSRYSSRIVETLTIDTTAIIIDTYHKSAYTTPYVQVGYGGRTQTKYIYHPEKNEFLFDTYWENEHLIIKNDVSHDNYISYNKDDEVKIHLTKEWRADHSITYSIEIINTEF